MTTDKSKSIASLNAKKTSRTRRSQKNDATCITLRNTTFFDYHFQVTNRNLEDEMKSLLATQTNSCAVTLRTNMPSVLFENTRWFIYAIDWFEQLIENYGIHDEQKHQKRYDFMRRLFDSFTIEQKTILQKGYNIRNRRSSPTLNLNLFHVELEWNSTQQKSIDFPVRVNSNISIH